MRAQGVAGAAGAAPSFQLNPQALETLMGMGFDRSRAEAALRQAGNSVDQALALLL